MKSSPQSATFPAWKGYQSIRPDEEPAKAPQVPGLAQQQPSSLLKRHRKMPRLRDIVSVTSITFVLLLVIGGGSFPAIPTREEAELARHYDIPWGQAARRLRSAQSLADKSRATYLDSEQAFAKAMKEINKKLKDSHYVGPSDGGDYAADGPSSPTTQNDEIATHNGKGGKDNHEHVGNEKKGPIPPPVGCEATVLIVRHCEKGKIREHCAYNGYERSVYLASLFGDTPAERWPMPSYIFALKAGGRHNPGKMNFREIETVGPVAHKGNLTVDDSHTSGRSNELAKEILTYLESGEMCGKVTLVAWKHSNIGHLAHHLGCGPRQGCPLDYKGKNFDEAWQIKFVYTAQEHSEKKSLRLKDRPVWKIYGSVQPEGFDPLAFSKRVGDYPHGGTSHAGRWQKDEVAVPERKSPNDRKAWHQTRVGFWG